MTNGGSETPVAGAPVERRRPRRLRSLLLIVAGFLAALGAVAGGALLFFYDRATGIDRSTPQVAVDQFLDATLVVKDPERVALFVCDDWSADAAIAQVAAPADPRVAVSWGDSSVTVTGRDAIISTDVRLAVRDDDGLHEDVQTWTLRLEEDGGWRVCGLDKQGSLEP